MSPLNACLLRASGVGRSFPGVRALHDAQLCLRAGEVHALMGQNGAGKSTLVKVLTGAYPADAGSIELDGQPIRPASPLDAQRLGISTVYQEVNLCPNLSVAENLFIGRYPRRHWWRGGGIDWRTVEEQARRLLASLHIHVDVGQTLSSYSVAIQQMVAIARATSIRARVLILDEPTSSLDEDETEQLFALLKRLREHGIAILFVTHFLDQVYAIADRITVLRNGQFVGEWRTSELTAGALIAAMVGREVDAAPASSNHAASVAEGKPVPVLQARRIGRRGQLHDLDIDFHRAEIVGIAGLLGSGRTELARLLFGLDKADQGGEITVNGRRAEIKSPAAAIAQGLALLPEERKTEGIIDSLSVRENITLALQARMGLVPCLSQRQQREIAERFVKSLDIKTSSLDTPVTFLSGGTQQKALLGRWLATEPRFIILDEPTRGVDVVARREILDGILALSRKGMAVMFISAEIEEVLRLSDRIVVMRDRRKAGELPRGCDESSVYQLIAQHR